MKSFPLCQYSPLTTKYYKEMEISFKANNIQRIHDMLVAIYSKLHYLVSCSSDGTVMITANSAQQKLSHRTDSRWMTTRTYDSKCLFYLKDCRTLTTNNKIEAKVEIILNATEKTFRSKAFAPASDDTLETSAGVSSNGSIGKDKKAISGTIPISNPEVGVHVVDVISINVDVSECNKPYTYTKLEQGGETSVCHGQTNICPQITLVAYGGASGVIRIHRVVV